MSGSAVRQEQVDGSPPSETLAAAAERTTNKHSSSSDHRAVDTGALICDLDSMDCGPGHGPVCASRRLCTACRCLRMAGPVAASPTGLPGPRLEARRRDSMIKGGFAWHTFQQPCLQRDRVTRVFAMLRPQQCAEGSGTGQGHTKGLAHPPSNSPSPPASGPAAMSKSTFAQYSISRIPATCRQADGLPLADFDGRDGCSRHLC